MTETLTQNDMRIVVIPAKSREEIKQTKRLRVAAYCRVSTDDEEQKTSYKAQIKYYTEKINKNPEWADGRNICGRGYFGYTSKKTPRIS